MYSIPISIEIDGKEHHIRNNGDYRVILDCFSALEDTELDMQERLAASLIIFYDELASIDDLYKLGDVQEAARKMYDFFNCGHSQIGTKTNYKLIDWEQDEQLICSAINKVAGKEIRFEPYIHWWTFLGYYTAIGESPIATIITIREKIIKGKKLEKHEREFRTSNPEYFAWRSKSVDAQEIDKLARELWNSGE